VKPPAGRGFPLRVSVHIYRTLLRAYPSGLREAYGGEMTRLFRDLCREALVEGGVLGLAALWVRTLPELLYTSLKERSTMLNQKLYGTASGIAFAAGLILVWTSLGVGIIGRDGDPANLMYVGVLAVGFIGALVARFRPSGMARAVLAMAIFQALVGAIALIAGLGYPWSGPLELMLLNGFFIALFVGSAILFGHAAQEQTSTGA
jgi:hypothetical protein